jgi:phosphate transport system permease protein
MTASAIETMAQAQADSGPKSRAQALARLKFTDAGFRLLTQLSATLVLLLLLGVAISLFIGAWPAFRAFGLDFFVSDAWSPPKERFGAYAAIYGTLATSAIAMLIGVPVGLGIAVFLTELCPPSLRRPIGVAIELLAGIPSIIYGIWGIYYLKPIMQAYVQPAIIATLGAVPGVGLLFAGPPLGYGVLTAGLVLAVMILPFVTAISRDVRRRRNGLWIILSYAATAFGLTWLVLILGSLVWNGIGGLSLDVFTKMTAPPGVAGGLLNSIVGSLIVTALGLVIAAPLGILAGTYLAEYGRYARIATVIRFVNDILLSAPSIVIGLFVYQLLVVPFGHFSALAGGVALAIIATPIVVRTTEDMLNLVPSTLREAATALGMPRSLVIRRVAYRAVRTGLVTGVLLAIARMTGETAPLIFTALGNSLFTADPTQPMSSLPLIIYEFARSPYPEQQKLAWTGALIVTFAVLSLSIAARALSASRSGEK